LAILRKREREMKSRKCFVAQMRKEKKYLNTVVHFEHYKIF